VTHAHAIGLALLILAVVLVAVLTQALPRVAGRVSALVLAVLGVVWLMANGPIEGGTLVTLTSSHGITDGDMLSVAAFVVAAYTLVRSLRR